MEVLSSNACCNPKTKRWRFVLIFLVSFVFIISPVINFNGGGVGARLGANLGFIFCLTFVVMVLRGRSIPRIVFIVLATAFSFLVYSLFVAFVTTDPSPIAESIVLMSVIISSYVYALVLHRTVRGDVVEVFLKTLFLLAIFWGATLIISFYSSSFRDFLSILFYRNYLKGAHLVDLRVPGFHPVGGDGGSMNLALVTLICSGYLRYLTGLKLVVSIILLVLVMLSTGLAARSGIFIGLPFLLIAILSVVRLPVHIKLITALSFAFLLIIGLYLFASFSLTNYNNLMVLLGYEHPFSRMVRFINNFAHGGVNPTVIGTLLGRMFEIPSNPVHLLLGTGSFSRHLPSTDMISGTDVGYLRVLNGVGIIGSFLMYLTFILPFIMLFRIMSKNTWLLRLSILAFCFVFIGHIKIEYVNTVTAGILLFSLVFVSSIQKRRKINV